MNQLEIMRRVVALSRKGMSEGYGGPFGCVVVRNGEIVAEAHNEVLATKDPTAHAELLAIRRASERLGTYDLSGCDIYTNGSPCCMCAAAMLWARVRTSFYILPMTESAAIGLGDENFYEELGRPVSDRKLLPMVRLAEPYEEAKAVYSDWFNMPGRSSY